MKIFKQRKKLEELKEIKLNFKECPHCKFIGTLGEVQSNREYWLITEIFVYLHDGKDFCNNKIQSR